MIKDSDGSRRLFGVYRGVVFDNKDPNNLGRLRLKIPQVFADVPTSWCWQLGAVGLSLSVPEVGQGVWVSFEGGDPSFPMWIGVFGTDQSDNTNIAIKPIASGTAVPSNFKYSVDSSGKTNLDLINSLINVASAIDGGSA